MTTFPLWYAQYPRKVARAAAEKAWSKLTLPERKQALDALPDHVRRWRLLGTEWEWLPHPASWINAKRFLDELPNNGGARHELAVPSNRASAARSHGSKGEQIEPMNPDGARNSQCGDWPLPPSNGASAQPANAHGCRGSQSPACSTTNVPAALDQCPPTSSVLPALAAAAGTPSLKLATGPRPIGEIMGQLRAAIGVKR